MCASLHDPEPDRLTERRRAAACIAVIVTTGFGLGSWAAQVAPGPGWLWLCALVALSVSVAGQIVKAPPGLPVLTYHSVSAAPGWLPWAADISIAPETLDRQLALLRRMGLRVIDTEAWLTARGQGDGPSKDAVILQFDDGYLDSRVAAWPLLRRHKACATLFVSTDFIAPDQPVRPTMEQSPDPQWQGYLSWAELREMDASPEFSVQCHGTDHGRVVTGPEEVGVLRPTNLGTEAWLQWAQMGRDKHNWYQRETWPVPTGTPILQNAPALAHRRWQNGTRETQVAYEARVASTFTEAISRFEAQMGRAPRLFCWPQNATNPRARYLAQEAGFAATTAGRGRNISTAHPDIIARLHVGQNYAGWRSVWLDDLAFRAHIRCMQGHLIWSPVLIVIGALKRLHGMVVRGRLLTMSQIRGRA